MLITASDQNNQENNLSRLFVLLSPLDLREDTKSASLDTLYKSKEELV